MPKTRLLVPVESLPNSLIERINELMKGETEMGWDNQLLDALDQENGQFIIGCIGNGGLRVSTSPKVHGSFSEATTEADRLAAANPGSKYVVLRIGYIVSAKPVRPQYELVRDTAVSHFL